MVGFGGNWREIVERYSSPVFSKIYTLWGHCSLESFWHWIADLPSVSVDDLRRIIAGSWYEHEAASIVVVAHGRSRYDHNQSAQCDDAPSAPDECERIT